MCGWLLLLRGAPSCRTNAHTTNEVSTDSHLVEGRRTEWSFQFFPLIIIINTLSPFTIPSVFDELVPRVHTEQSSPITDSRVLIDVPEVINNVRSPPRFHSIYKTGTATAMKWVELWRSGDRRGRANRRRSLLALCLWWCSGFNPGTTPIHHHHVGIAKGPTFKCTSLVYRPPPTSSLYHLQTPN